MNTTNSGPHLARSLLVLAAVVGLGADLLVREHFPDARTGVWMAIPVLGLLAVAYRHDIELSRATRVWLGMSLLVGGLLAGRATPFLTFLTVIGWLGCLVMAGWEARGGTPFSAPVTELPRQALGTAVHAAFGAPSLLVRAVISPRQGVDPSSRGRFPRLVMGATLATPLLVLFGTLFAAADPVFYRGLQAVTRFDLTSIGIHATWFLGASWVAAGVARRLLCPVEARDPQVLDLTPRPPTSAPSTEVATVLALIALLFLAFVAVQVRYLFGDHALVQQTVGLTYAEYARRGFFELLAVALLLLPVLLLADWALTHGEDRRALRGWTTLLLILLAVILASAFRRMHLYTEAYGWTGQRFFAVAALAWVCLATAIFAGTVLRGFRVRFAAPVTIAALVVLGALHVINPDAFVARNQVERARTGRALDLDHLRRLGPDAIPPLVASLPTLPEDQQTALAGILRRRQATLTGWSLAHLAARRALETLPHSQP